MNVKIKPAGINEPSYTGTERVLTFSDEYKIEAKIILNFEIV